MKSIHRAQTMDRSPNPQNLTKTENLGVPARSAGPAGPGIVPGSLRSVGCTKYQPRRPILAQFRASAEIQVCGGGGSLATIHSVSESCFSLSVHCALILSSGNREDGNNLAREVTIEKKGA